MNHSTSSAQYNYRPTEEDLPAYSQNDPSFSQIASGQFTAPRSVANDRKEENSDKKDTPVVAMDPIEFNGKLVDWNFMSYNENFLNEILTFVSQDAREKYKTFKGISGGYNLHASRLQSDGFAMPLLRTDHHTFGSMHSRKYMSFYKYIPPPAHERRLFNKNIDKFKFCEATKERCSSYYKYELKFTPDPNNPRKGFTLIMIDHHRHPIIDVSPYKGYRFRWVCAHLLFRSKWSYTLNILQEGQVSLIDKLDSRGKVSKSNPLLGNTFKNNLLPMSRDTQSFVGLQVGVAHETLDYFHSWHCLPPLRFAFLDIMNETDVDHTESVNAVGLDSLVFLCMSSIFKRIEDNKERARRSAN